MYKVIKNFVDLQDNRYRYLVGDTYPRKGVKVSEDRVAELSSTKNKRGVKLIEKTPEKKTSSKKSSESKRSTRSKKKQE